MPITTSLSLPHSWWAPKEEAMRRSDPRVDVFVARDVVFLEIVAGLHFDDFERLAAGIAQPMDAADRDIDRFVFVQGHDPAVEHHLGDALDHHPMLGPALVALQAELAAGLDAEPLGAKALATVDVLVAAPRPVHYGVLGGGLLLAVRHALHDVLQPRKVVAMADQHGIVHRHDDHFLDA